jgi:hypothetical protein
MRNIQIFRDKFGLQYKTELLSSAFSYFPDGIQTKQDMIKFFCRDGWDMPQLNFVDNKGKPIKYYQIKRGQNFAICDFDPAKRVLFDARPDILEHLEKYSSADDINEASKLSPLDDRIEFLKREASAATLKEVEDLIAAKNSDSGLTEACKQHAKEYFNCEAIIEFQISECNRIGAVY